MEKINKENQLLTKDFCCLFVANFLMLFAGGYWADSFGGFHASYFIEACLALLGCVVFMSRRSYLKFITNHNH